MRPGLASQALLKGEEPNALPSPFSGRVSEPDRARLAVVGDSRLAEDDAVWRNVGRVVGVVGYAGDKADVRVRGPVAGVAGVVGGVRSSGLDCRSVAPWNLDGRVLLGHHQLGTIRTRACSPSPCPSQARSSGPTFFRAPVITRQRVLPE